MHKVVSLNFMHLLVLLFMLVNFIEILPVVAISGSASMRLVPCTRARKRVESKRPATAVQSHCMHMQLKVHAQCAQSM